MITSVAKYCTAGIAVQNYIIQTLNHRVRHIPLQSTRQGLSNALRHVHGVVVLTAKSFSKVSGVSERCRSVTACEAYKPRRRNGRDWLTGNSPSNHSNAPSPHSRCPSKIGTPRLDEVVAVSLLSAFVGCRACGKRLLTPFVVVRTMFPIQGFEQTAPFARTTKRTTSKLRQGRARDCQRLGKAAGLVR